MTPSRGPHPAWRAAPALTCTVYAVVSPCPSTLPCTLRKHTFGPSTFPRCMPLPLQVRFCCDYTAVQHHRLCVGAWEVCICWTLAFPCRGLLFVFACSLACPSLSSSGVYRDWFANRFCVWRLGGLPYGRVAYCACPALYSTATLLPGLQNIHLLPLPPFLYAVPR